MLTFQKVTSEKEIHAFIDLKLALMQYHMEYAQNQGIEDMELQNYHDQDAQKHLFDRESFLIKLKEQTVGILQISQSFSETDNTPILFVHSLYFCEKYRNMGLGVLVLKYLCSTYHKRIECECWYDIPAKEMYEKIGFKPLYSRYFLPIDHKFYDSDQN